MDEPFEKLSGSLKALLEGFGQLVPKKEEKKKGSGTKNKSVKASKKRRKMAQKSNRINRKRIKKWKY